MGILGKLFGKNQPESDNTRRVTELPKPNPEMTPAELQDHLNGLQDHTEIVEGESALQFTDSSKGKGHKYLNLQPDRIIGIQDITWMLQKQFGMDRITAYRMAGRRSISKD